MSGQLVQIDATNPAIVQVSLDRADKRNALSLDLMRQLHDAIKHASEDTRCRVLILRGNGPAFCAGLDLQEASIPGNIERSAQALAELYETLCLTPVATIAAVQGAVLGGGVGLLAACDLVVVADDARIGFPEVRRGLVAALVTALLRRQLPERILRELILLGRTVDAAEARSIGLVNRVVSPNRLSEEVVALATEACRGAPGAIARTKRLFEDLAPRPIAEELRLALRYHLEARDEAEAAEGIAAFIEKREPRWKT